MRKVQELSSKILYNGLCSDAMASMIENGKRNPSDKLKIKMANLYKTTIGVIFLALETTKCSIKKGE